MQHLVYGPVIGITTSLISSVNVADTRHPVIVLSRSISSADGIGTIGWCNTYTDGWMEQGGYVASASMGSWSSKFVPFTWSFLGSPVFVQCLPFTTSSVGTSDKGLYGVFSVTDSGFYYCRGAGPASSIGIQWVAKGMNPNWDGTMPGPDPGPLQDGYTLYTQDVTVNSNAIAASLIAGNYNIGVDDNTMSGTAFTSVG